MEVQVFFIVLLAALFHATWNAFVKVEGDRLIFMGGVVGGQWNRRPEHDALPAPASARELVIHGSLDLTPPGLYLFARGL